MLELWPYMGLWLVWIRFPWWVPETEPDLPAPPLMLRWKTGGLGNCLCPRSFLEMFQLWGHTHPTDKAYVLYIFLQGENVALGIVVIYFCSTYVINQDFFLYYDFLISNSVKEHLI